MCVEDPFLQIQLHLCLLTCTGKQGNSKQGNSVYEARKAFKKASMYDSEVTCTVVHSVSFHTFCILAYYVHCKF